MNRFILTGELGRLAKWLRVLGYDTLYMREKDRARLVILGLREDRIIITRAPALDGFTGLTVVRIIHDNVKDQLEQLITELGLKISKNAVFTRCTGCNTALADIERSAVKGAVPSYVYDTQDGFKTCATCGKIFWKGTHWDLAIRFLDERINH